MKVFIYLKFAFTFQKESVVETVRNENEHLTGEIQRLRNEIQQLQSMHDASTNEVCALKHQLDEKLLLATNSPAVIAVRTLSSLFDS